MNELCDIVGINLTNGPVVLRLALDTDGVDDDTIVSLFPRIHELTYGFQQYRLLHRKEQDERALSSVACVPIAYAGDGLQGHACTEVQAGVILEEDLHRGMGS